MDLREGMRLVERYPRGGPEFESILRISPRLPYEANRRRYLSQLAVLGATNRYLRHHFDELEREFKTIARPEPE